MQNSVARWILKFTMRNKTRMAWLKIAKKYNQRDIQNENGAASHGGITDHTKHLHLFLVWEPT